MIAANDDIHYVIKRAHKNAMINIEWAEVAMSRTFPSVLWWFDALDEMRFLSWSTSLFPFPPRILGKTFGFLVAPPIWMLWKFLLLMSVEWDFENWKSICEFIINYLTRVKILITWSIIFCIEILKVIFIRWNLRIFSCICHWFVIFVVCDFICFTASIVFRYCWSFSRWSRNFCCLWMNIYLTNVLLVDISWWLKNTLTQLKLMKNLSIYWVISHHIIWYCCRLHRVSFSQYIDNFQRPLSQISSLSCSFSSHIAISTALVRYILSMKQSFHLRMECATRRKLIKVFSNSIHTSHNHKPVSFTQ